MTCECGCGRPLGSSPSMWFRDQACQTLYACSVGQPDPVAWRARQRLLHVLHYNAPGWGSSYVEYNRPVDDQDMLLSVGLLIWRRQAGHARDVFADMDPDWRPGEHDVVELWTASWQTEWTDRKLQWQLALARHGLAPVIVPDDDFSRPVLPV